MREKQIPVDSVEIKETIHAFAWEPVGSKFAVIHGEPPTPSVSFYEVKTGQTPTLAKKYERKPCNQLYWAPSGKISNRLIVEDCDFPAITPHLLMTRAAHTVR